MSSFWMPKKQPLYAPMLASFGGGSARGYGRGGRSGISPFSLTLVPTSYGRTGDSLTAVNAFWASAPSEAASVLFDLGIQTYTGYYACTIEADVTIDVTAGGAAGWRNTNGRSISASFQISAGTRLVFFAGKSTMPYSTGQQQGAGGGASVVATYNTTSGVFTPLVVAAGGSASYSTRKNEGTARPLSVTLSGNVNSARNSVTPFSYPTSGGYGGVGRSAAQSGGAGWNGRGYFDDGSIDTSSGEALNAGAQGGSSGSGAEGGFGGGGCDRDGNSYGAGGGGYFGAFEHSASTSPTAGNEGIYLAYTLSRSTFSNDYLGPLSYVSPSATSYSDNGLHGPTTDEAAFTSNTKGLVQISFS